MPSKQVCGGQRLRSMTDIAIHRVDRLELPCRPHRWAFAEDRRHDIATYFAERQA
jgi:hypothetical protein